MNKKDPYGIPNTCFTLVNKKDSRWKKFKKQRVNQGFDESEFWEFENTLCSWLLPRVEWYYKNIAKDIYPEDEEVLSKFIYCLWFVINKYKLFDYSCENNVLSFSEFEYSYNDCLEFILEHMKTIFNMGF